MGFHPAPACALRQRGDETVVGIKPRLFGQYLPGLPDDGAARQSNGIEQHIGNINDDIVRVGAPDKADRAGGHLQGGQGPIRRWFFLGYEVGQRWFRIFIFQRRGRIHDCGCRGWRSCRNDRHAAQQRRPHAKGCQHKYHCAGNGSDSCALQGEYFGRPANNKPRAFEARGGYFGALCQG